MATTKQATTARTAPGQSVTGAAPALPELPDEYIWNAGGQPYIVCAFYTPNYLPQISSLKASSTPPRSCGARCRMLLRSRVS